MFEDFLSLVSKPGRYINSEINATHKDLSHVKTKVCLFFPDTYEVGMSHLGLRILYDILNGRDDTACERVFSPWLDYEQRLSSAGRPLRSLESNEPLTKFDIIGITLQYELSYSNILAGLRLAEIPLHTVDRTDNHPIIVAGGPCAVNPEPLSAFIDAFFIGDGEEAVHQIIELRQQHPGRFAYLKALSQSEGFYVPILGKKNVRRRIVRDLESAHYPNKPIVPLMKPIHDRISIEVARGCIRGCRFCQAGVIYRPYRERSPELIKSLVSESLHCTGYDELSLASLSSGDYSDIQPLMQDIAETYHDDRLSLSLPSLRIGTLTSGMIQAIAAVRKTGFTLAPEAGTERLRAVINKPVSDADLMSAARLIFSNGWSVLKLYFMIGLPTETNEDLDGIINLAHKLLTLGRSVSKRHIQINITISTFVPKPHTPFQWFSQATREEIKFKQSYLAQGLRQNGIVLKPHSPEMSLLESAFARGDSRIGPVIEEAVRLGCRFDGWSECFDIAKWEQAFHKYGLTPELYTSRRFEQEEALPWDYVHVGVTKTHLQREYRRALDAKITENCRIQCESCGLGCPEGGSERLGRPSNRIPDSQKTSRVTITRHRDSTEISRRSRIRMKFTKSGRMRFLSHLDLMTLFQRATSRAEIPVAFSQGFNPHPKIAFGPALSVGIESLSEYLDVETTHIVDLLLLKSLLNDTLPEGIRIVQADVIPSKTPSLSGSISRYSYGVQMPEKYWNEIEARVSVFLSNTSVLVANGEGQKNIRQCIEAIEISGDINHPGVSIILVDRERIKPRIQDVVAQLFAVKLEQLHLFGITRTGMFYQSEGCWKNPLEVS